MWYIYLALDHLWKVVCVQHVVTGWRVDSPWCWYSSCFLCPSTSRPTLGLLPQMKRRKLFGFDLKKLTLMVSGRHSLVHSADRNNNFRATFYREQVLKTISSKLVFDFSKIFMSKTSVPLNLCFIKLVHVLPIICAALNTLFNFYQCWDFRGTLSVFSWNIFAFLNMWILTKTG